MAPMFHPQRGEACLSTSRKGRATDDSNKRSDGGRPMRVAASILLALMLVLGLPSPEWGQSPQSSQAATAAQAPANSSPSTEAGVTYQEIVFLPSYRFVSPSGFAGRV